MDACCAEPGSRCGTRTSYVHYGCTCTACRAANADYHASATEARARRLDEAEHGTASTYTNWLCRCEPCTAAHNERMRNQRARLVALIGTDATSVQHGTHSGYSYGCRCEPCREVIAAYGRARYLRRKAAA